MTLPSKVIAVSTTSTGSFPEQLIPLTQSKLKPIISCHVTIYEITAFCLLFHLVHFLPSENVLFFLAYQSRPSQRAHTHLHCNILFSHHQFLHNTARLKVQVLDSLSLNTSKVQIISQLKIRAEQSPFLRNMLSELLMCCVCMRLQASLKKFLIS